MTVGFESEASNELTYAPRSGFPVDAAFRAVLYPTWKLNDHWSVSGAYEIYSVPYFEEQFSTEGHAVRGDLLQGTINYSWVGPNAAISVRAGELLPSFGSFLLRYDDFANPLIRAPLQYGYYYKPVAALGAPGGQIDATWGRWDGRLQLSNSSLANPRSVLDHDQYANWSGGAGYTIYQGFRVGASTYHGPYLDRTDKFYLPGEAPPRDLPATAVGFDADWARGHWNVYGEVQRFRMPYHVLPVFRETAGYIEARRVLSPRWYLAARTGFIDPTVGNSRQSYEFVAGFRPNRIQLLKIGYALDRWNATSPELSPTKLSQTIALQLVTSLHPLSIARN